MIELKNVYRTYQTEEVLTEVLKDIDLRIEAGDFVAIMGPSGSGKSTLLHVLGLLDQIDQGEYFFESEEVSRLGADNLMNIRKKRIGFVFQNFNLIDDLNVFENIEIPLKILKVSKESRTNFVLEALEKLKITHRASHFPSQLSGGQKQRVAIARALVSNPKIILADEPTGNLDSHAAKITMDILADLNKEGKTIVMVTHSDLQAQYANRIIHINDGRINKENNA